MTINKEQMERIRSHLDGNRSEAMGAWILDKNALNLALERVAELEKLVPKPGEMVIREDDYTRLVASIPATPLRVIK